jgi:muramoyltetrapeptide carboxypeptidase
MKEIAEPLLPPGLELGDTIGLVAPAGPILDRTAFTEGVRILEAAGYRIKVPADLFRQEDYLAGTDRERARQFSDTWRDPEVKAVLAVRGGYGCMRLLPLLDPAQLAAQPKILAGFSDLTVLLNELSRNLELVTWHAPMLNTLARCDEESLASFLDLLAGRQPAEIRPAGLHILRPGLGRGRLIGGNLACLSHLVGTPHEPDWQDAILFLEDTGEPLYRVDRMLTHLERAGCLRKLAGLILGTFTNGKGEEEPWAELVWNRVLEVAGEDYPIWGNFPVGHGSRNLSLPVGAAAVLDSESGGLSFPGY